MALFSTFFLMKVARVVRVVATGENPQPSVLRDNPDHTHLLNSVPLPFIMLQVSLTHME